MAKKHSNIRLHLVLLLVGFGLHMVHAEQREGAAPPNPRGIDRGPFAFITLGKKVEGVHLEQVNQSGDGATMRTEMEGVACHMISSQPGLPPAYIYFRLDPGLKLHQEEVIVTVEYYDAATGSISIDYDSFDEKSLNKPYTRSPTRVELKNDNRWHKAAFLLEYPKFQHGMHDGGDFRIAAGGRRLFVRTVQVSQQ